MDVLGFLCFFGLFGFLFVLVGWLVLLELRQITILVNLFIVVVWDIYCSSFYKIYIS